MFQSYKNFIELIVIKKASRIRAFMSKELKINLNSQREILQEGAQKNFDVNDSSSLTTGSIKKEFFLPELKIDSSLDSHKTDSQMYRLW